MFTNHQSPNTNSDVKILDWCRKWLSADFCRLRSHKSLVVFLELTTKIEFSPQSPLRNTASQIVDSFLAMTAALGRNEWENREKETHKHWQTEVETYRMQSEQERRKKAIFDIFGMHNLLGGKAITVHLWMRRWERGRCGKNGIWNPERVFKKILREPRYFQHLILQVIYYTKIVFDDSGWSDFADLIRDERVHLANEASNLVKH